MDFLVFFLVKISRIFLIVTYEQSVNHCNLPVKPRDKCKKLQTYQHG